MTFQGFGASQTNFIVYCANTPQTTLLAPNTITPICYEDIEKINAENGNGWRKIFNVYAKLLFEINPLEFKSWQALRNNYLLQSHCNHQLILNPTDISANDDDTIQILMGKTFALTHFKENDIQWIDSSMGKVHNTNIFITPYFDYRQFSNAKIEQFAHTIL